MKRLLYIALIMVLTITSVGCGDKKTESNEINVYMLNPDMYMESFLSSYRGESGEITVNVEIGMTSTDMNIGDALKKLNTELMGDEGPDIIVLDGINPKGYIESGKFEKLNGIIDGKKDLIDGFRKSQGDEIYYVPLSIGVIGEFYKPELQIDFDNIESYVNSIKTNDTKSGFFSDNAIIAYKTDLEPLLIKNKNIDRGILQTFFENIKGLLAVSQDMQGILKSSIGPHDYTPDSTLDYMKIFFNKAGATRTYVLGIEELQQIYNFREGGKISFELAEINDEIVYMPNCILAVNKNSINKEKSMKMIEYLLSKEGQLDVANIGGYIPINTVALKETLAVKETYNEYVQIGEDSQNFMFRAFTKDQIEEIVNYLEEVSYECNSDAYLMEIVLTAAQDYTNGKMSLEAALDSTMSKIQIYMSE